MKQQIRIISILVFLFWFGCVNNDISEASVMTINNFESRFDTLKTEYFPAFIKTIPAYSQDSVCLSYIQWLSSKEEYNEVVKLYSLGIFSNPGSKIRIPIQVNAANAYYNINNPDSALLLLDGLENILKKKNALMLGKVYHLYAQCRESLNQLPEAVDYYYKSMDTYREAGAENEYNHVKIDLATIFFFLKDYTKSISLHQESFAYFSEHSDTIQMAYILDGITVALDNLDNIEEASKAARKSLLLYRAKNDKQGMSVALNNMAHLYKRHGELDKAEPYLREGLKLMESIGNQRYIPVCLSNLGNCLLELGKLGEAETVLLRAKREIANFGSETTESANIELALAKLYRKKSMPEKSLIHQVEYDRQKDSLNSRERMRILAAAASRYENKVRESEITRLNYNNEIAHSRFRFTLIGIFSVLLLTGGWYMARTKRIRLMLEKEKEVLRERSLVQDAQLQLARSELGSFAKTIHEKSKLLDDLHKKFESNPESFANPESTYRYISEMHHHKILTEDDWEKFKNQFEQVYPGLTTKIRINYADISQAELRLALLLKLNLDTKEIAATLGVSPDTVKKTRQRLRRRVGISEDENLKELIHNL